MKKKGFTLVELLGVIVVLAIIALIAVPTIMGVVDKAKKGSLQDSAYGLIEAADLYYAQYLNGKTVRFDISDNNMTTEEENKLIYKGNIKNGTVLINNKGEVTVCINDGKHAAYKNYKDTKVTVVDSKTCTVPESSYIVYLDGESTVTEMTALELTEAITNLTERVNNLEQENTEIIAENTTLKSQISEIKTSVVAIDEIYPIGSIYISTSNKNPSSLFKNTKWEIYGQNRMLLGISESEISEKTGGSSTATLSVANLPSHTHSIPSLSGKTDTSGSHTHTLNNATTSVINLTSGTHYAVFSNGNNSTLIQSSGSHTHNITTTASTTGTIGSGASFSVQNPYITVYMWKRVS